MEACAVRVQGLAVKMQSIQGEAHEDSKKVASPCGLEVLGYNE